MAECARCGAFTDNEADGEYHYCDDCLADFATIEQSGVVVEQATEGGAYHLIVTDGDASLDGGQETSQVDALARGKYICDECGLNGVFKYAPSGSTWVLSEYLQAHPGIRQDVHERLRRVPDEPPGLLDRIRNFL
ncbi:hypothetical protein [Haloarcula argentinensis]|uniref:Uncharacterized protein n=1 Tax=Haloarcula argentinensis TaxID=43776 RepID=A0A830FW81_HALAR|nr:hypothetical protein [Haloarcula argentinensis]MDS0255825.1 hypothetical protein [Haloarcula argentinensis]GGM50146.1 hypothetical protein GCM10009006_34180 [Haloarcula argentinensis]